MSLQYYDSANEALIPIAGNVNPSDVIELKASKADKTQISNRNLLDNPWFTVNQRNFVDTPLSNYTVDRWKTRNTTLVSYSNGIISLTHNRSDGATWFGQNLELDVARRLIGKTVTVSILTGNGTLESWTFVVPAEGTILDTTRKTVDGVECYFKWEWGSNSCACYFWLATSAYQKTITLKAVKLELGYQSTLAMDTIPNYTTELLKCQRYFVNYPNSAHPLNLVGVSYETGGIFNLPLPCAMRTTPAITILNAGNMFDANGTLLTRTGSFVDAINVNNLRLYLGVSETLPNFRYTSIDQLELSISADL